MVVALGKLTFDLRPNPAWRGRVFWGEKTLQLQAVGNKAAKNLMFVIEASAALTCAGGVNLGSHHPTLLTVLQVTLL